MKERIGSEEGINEVKSYLLGINKSLRRDICIYGKVPVLNGVYSALYFKKDPDSFKLFVENRIASEKEYIFKITVTPSRSGENVQVLNHWGDKLGEEVGLSEEYLSGGEMLEQDPFRDNDGNALHAFYSRFTMNHMIKSLVSAINDSTKRFDEACGLLDKYVNWNAKDNMENREYMFEFKDRDSLEAFIPEGIGYGGVETILLDMGILRRRVEEITTC